LPEVSAAEIQDRNIAGHFTALEGRQTGIEEAQRNMDGRLQTLASAGQAFAGTLANIESRLGALAALVEASLPKPAAPAAPIEPAPEQPTT